MLSSFVLNTFFLQILFCIPSNCFTGLLPLINVFFYLNNSRNTHCYKQGWQSVLCFATNYKKWVWKDKGEVKIRGILMMPESDQFKGGYLKIWIFYGFQVKCYKGFRARKRISQPYSVKFRLVVGKVLDYLSIFWANFNRLWTGNDPVHNQ